MVDAATPLGDLVTARPQLAPVLDELGLDYCCGGQRTLADACQEAKVPLDRALGVLAAQPSDPTPAPWARMTPAELVDDIVATHHAHLRWEIPRLLDLGWKVVGVHGVQHPELDPAVRTLAALWHDLEPHLAEEEVTLFPAVRGGTPVPDSELGRLVADHEAVGRSLDHLRRLTDDFEVPADGCASYTAFYAGLRWLDGDTRLHVHKENNVLLPAVAGTTG